jgi:glycosyltransferase involved in cell wall biosynthesis
MTDPFITIIVPTYNEGPYLAQCIQSLLQQSYPAFELIISDDCSSDATQEIVQSFNDPRLIYLRNATRSGVSITRNNAIQRARGEYIFFTDGDCHADPHWLESGLEVFRQHPGCVGVEGKIYYVRPDYIPTYSDRVVENLTGGEYMSASIAYRRDVLLKTSLFDPVLYRHQDLDIALQMMEFGEIIFAPEMVIFHVYKKWNLRSYWNYAISARCIVLLYKRHRQKLPKAMVRNGIYAPDKLLTMLFPPIVALMLLVKKFKSADDFKLLLLIYPRIVYERLLLWQTCWQERIFLL